MITLAFTCAHVAPGQDLSRFNALGQLIVKRRPDNIVSLGDFVTVDSLTAWDQNKRLLLEGRRYQGDMLAGGSALYGIFNPITSLRNRQRFDKKRRYTPRVVWILGNHEDRVRRYVEVHAEMAGHLDAMKDLNLESRVDWGFEVVPYKESIEIGGINFTHAVLNEKNEPIAGKYALRNSADRVGASTIFGHTHRFETLSLNRYGTRLIQVSMIGTFSNETPFYAKGGLNHYWQGCVIVHHLKDGRYDLEMISLNRLMEGKVDG